jgi:hypothetical protein
MRWTIYGDITPDQLVALRKVFRRFGRALSAGTVLLLAGALLSHTLVGGPIFFLASALLLYAGRIVFYNVDGIGRLFGPLGPGHAHVGGALIFLFAIAAAFGGLASRRNVWG